MIQPNKIYHKENKLRYAVMCNGASLQQWQINCLDQLQQLDFVEPVLLILPKQEENRKKSFFQKVKEYPYGLFFYRLSKRIFKHPLQKSNPLPDYLKLVPTCTCEVEQKGKYSQYFNEQDIKHIQSFQPHFIIRFGFNIIRGEILTCTPYGVWSFHHGNEEEFRGGPPAFWEVYQDKKTVGAILQKLTHELDGGIVLRKGNFPVTRYSVRETLTRTYHLSAIWMKQVCIDLSLAQAHYFHNSSSASGAKIYTFPGNGIVFKYGLKKISRKINFHWNDLFRPETWMVGLVKLESSYEPGQPFPQKVQWIRSENKNSYSADPFIMDQNDQSFLLVEEYSYKTGLGRIDVIDLATQKRAVLIQEAFHLSYPFCLKQEGKIYVLPEAANSNKVTLYEVDLKRHSILQKHTLLEGVQAFDPTLHFYQGLWWLMVSQKETESNTCLHIYFAESILGPYTSHANNPVKADVANARPAGPLQQFDAKLFRPAQNSSRTYGGSVVMNQITVLSTTRFEEEKKEEIEPREWFPYKEGLHTFTLHGNYLVFDCKKHRFNAYNLRTKLLKKLRMRR